jgi:hypothetical protein
MRTKYILLAGILILGASLQASTSLAFVSGNSLIVPNTPYEVSPYTGTIAGDPNLNNGAASSITLYCDDFTNGVVYTSGSDSGQDATWSVNVNSVTSSSLDGANGGRYETANNLPTTTTLYEEAAWLAAEVQSASQVTGTQAQITAAHDNEINAQEALWELTGGTDPNQNAGTGVTGVTNIAGWLADATAEYNTEPTGYYSNWFVITETGEAGQTGGYQEFLAYSSSPISTTNSSATPEPASFFLIGSGLLVGAAVARRRMKKKSNG